MIISVVVIFCIFALASLPDDTQKAFRFGAVWAIIGVVLVLISANRPVEMPDYAMYAEGFRFDDKGRYEPGYASLMHLIRAQTSDVFYLMLVMATIAISIRLYAIKRFSNFIWLSLAVYVSNVFILHDMIQIRAAIASGMLLFAIYYAHDRKWIKFIITTLIATMFHYSAISFLIIPFFVKDNFKKSIYSLIIPLGYILSLSGVTVGHMVSLVPIPFVQKSYEMYVNAMDLGEGDKINIFNAFILIRIAIAYLLIIGSAKMQKHNRLFLIWLKLYILGIIAFLLCRDIPALAFRLSELFFAVDILLYPMLVYLFRYKNRAWCKVAVIIVGACSLFINIGYNEFLL